MGQLRRSWRGKCLINLRSAFHALPALLKLTRLSHSSLRACDPQKLVIGFLIEDDGTIPALNPKGQKAAAAPAPTDTTTSVASSGGDGGSSASNKQFAMDAPPPPSKPEKFRLGDPSKVMGEEEQEDGDDTEEEGAAAEKLTT